jgi:hypothetical protein
MFNPGYSRDNPSNQKEGNEERFRTNRPTKNAKTDWTILFGLAPELSQ